MYKNVLHNQKGTNINMDWIKVFIFTSTEGIEPVCGMLYQMGINSVQIIDADDFQNFLKNHKQYWDYIDEELLNDKQNEESCVIVYINNSASGREQLIAIQEGVKRIKNIGDDLFMGKLEVKTDIVNEEDWANNWKKYYKPIKIGENLIIKPAWEKLDEPTDRIIVNINPGMMFGTGTHESTRMCMKLLEKFVKEDTRLFDVGAGSGILSITALLLGAKSAFAVDIDENVNEVAMQNAKLNGVEDRIKVKCLDLATGVKETYNMVVANIVADVIIRLVPQLPALLEDGGVFITSGIIDDREEDVKNAIKKAGLEIIEVLYENDWVAIAATKC